MSEFVSFAVNEIEKIGLICPNCKSEVVLTLHDKEPRPAPHRCPVCLAEQKPFARYKPDWMEYMRMLKDADDGSAVRMYFKEKK